jgi:hypothetical protein
VTPPSGRSQPRRRPRAVWAAAGVVALAVVFGIGLALGEALHDNPRPDGPRTLVRTLEPLPVSPAPVTVTVQKPRK